MANKEIILSFDQVGNAKIDAQNFTGESCRDATKAFEQALAGASAKETVKPEMYQAATNVKATATARRF